jgi:hypothetical protein
MINERATEICLDLLTHRVLPRSRYPDLNDDDVLRTEVSRRLQDVGLTFVDRPGIPFIGTVVHPAYRSEDLMLDGLDRRAVGLILFIWMRLVLPHVYLQFQPPADLRSVMVTTDSLRAGLPGGWSKTLLERYLAILRRLQFVETIRGQDAICAGPMLWLAIDHEALCHQLRTEKGIQYAITRYHAEIETDQPGS